MIKWFRDWYHRSFSDSDFMVLFLFLVLIVASITFLGSILKPVLASVILAYLLSGLVDKLERRKCPHLLAVMLVYFSFIGVLTIAMVGILPPLIRQTTSFFQDLPRMLNQGRLLLLHLPERFPGSITSQQIDTVMKDFQSIFGVFGKELWSFSLSTLSGFINLVLYLVLVPFLVYFFLMDREKIINYLSRFLPHHRKSLTKVWLEVHEQFGNYIQGRVIEIVLVGFVNYIAFLALGLDYAILLAVAVGFSVIVPYIGTVIITIPVLFVAGLQWGLTPPFFYLLTVYSILMILAGYVLEPVLFSEALDLHPVAIIVAMLFFGGIMGFWGVFFAIPLASVVQAVLRVWPRS